MSLLPKSIADLSRVPLRKALGKKAPAVVELIKNWPAIAGEGTAKYSSCKGVRFPSSGARTDGTLDLEVEPGAALFVEQDQVRILEKVNAFLGPKTVARLRINQRRVVDDKPIEATHLPPPRNCDELTDLLTEMRSRVHKKNT